MKAVRLTGQDENGQPRFTAQGEFDEADLVLLAEFVAAVGRVRQTALLQRGMPSMTGIRWADGQMRVTCEAVSNSELFELLHVLRPVILAEERSSFEKIQALLKRRFASRGFSDQLKLLHRLFEHGEMSGFMQMTVNDRPVFDASLLRTWLNGTQYHTDAEKASAWNAFEASVTSENARAFVVNQLHDRVKALLMLEGIVRLVLEAPAGTGAIDSE